MPPLITIRTGSVFWTRPSGEASPASARVSSCHGQARCQASKTSRPVVERRLYSEWERRRRLPSLRNFWTYVAVVCMLGGRRVVICVMIRRRLSGRVVGGDAKKMPLTLEAAFNNPGAYEAHFIPTLPGDYTYHISGKVENKDVDESFSSGPQTFDPVDDPSDLQFPDKLPTTAELQSSITALQSKSSGGSDDTARVLGVIGIIAGIVGVAAGGVALAARRS